MKGTHLPVALRWPGRDSGGLLALSKGFMTAPKTSSALRNAHYRVYPMREGNWLHIATIDVKPRSSSRPGSWAWGELAEGQQSGLLSCTCMFGSFSNSLFPSAKQGTISTGTECSDRWKAAAQSILAEGRRVCLETRPQYLCLGEEGTELLTSKFNTQS